MGNKCVCINNENESEIYTSHLPNEANVSRDEKMEMAKSAPKPKGKNPIQALQDRIAAETNKTITVSEITSDEFNKLIERDNRKRKLCEEHGIKLLYYSNLGIEYPYKVYEDKNELLNEILKK